VNRRAHAVGGAIAATLAAYLDECEATGTAVSADEAWARVCAACGFGALCGSLPDLLEPACHPNHRQFFHSVTCGLLLAVGIRRVSTWNPEERWEQWVRIAALAAGSAYLIHLIMDATTPKSLPVLGRL